MYFAILHRSVSFKVLKLIVEIKTYIMAFENVTFYGGISSYQLNLVIFFKFQIKYRINPRAFDQALFRFIFFTYKHIPIRVDRLRQVTTDFLPNGKIILYYICYFTILVVRLFLAVVDSLFSR